MFSEAEKEEQKMADIFETKAVLVDFTLTVKP